MPKQLHEIREFSKGMVTSVSEGDIPDNSAQLSINIDPIAEFGVLKSLSQDQILSTNGFEDSNTGTEIDAPASRINFINDSGTYHGIAMSSANNVATIIHISDIYNSPNPMSLSTDVFSSQNTLTSVVNNKELHIGTGNTASDTAQWVGIIGHPHFSDMEDTDIEIVDASIDTTTVFNYVDDIEADKTFIYGIHKENHRIYKFDMDDESIVTSAILDCEIIHCFTLHTPDINDSTKTVLYLMVEKSRGESDPEYVEFNNKYRIMVLDHNLAVLLNNVYYQITTPATAEYDYYQTFRICSKTGFHGEWAERIYTQTSHVPVAIKRIRDETNDTLWICIDVTNPLQDRPHDIENDMTYHVLDRGQWILNTYGGHLGGYPDINGVDTLVEQENLVLDLSVRTPWGFNGQFRSPTVNLPTATGRTGGVFGVASDSTDNLPTAAHYDDQDMPRLKLEKFVKIEGNTTGVGMICATNKPYSSLNKMPVVQTRSTAGNIYSRFTALYICISHGFSEVSNVDELYHATAPQGGNSAGMHTHLSYQSKFLFDRDPNTGSPVMDLNNCLLYHFGKRALDGSANITSTIDTSSNNGGWGNSSYWDMSDFASSYSVNEYYDDSKGIVATQSHVTGNDDQYYIRSFTNPDDDTVCIGYNGGEVGLQIGFTDDRIDSLIKGRVVPVSNTKVMFMLGESTTSPPKFGKLVGSGNWYDTGSAPDFISLVQSDIEITFSETNLAISSSFFNSYRYFWKLSFIYDGYQESPLSSSTSQDASSTVAADESFQITINLAPAISKRVSHVVLYRGDSAGIIPTSIPLGAYRQVKTIPLDSRWTHTGGIFSYTVIDSGSAGISYEASSGLPQNILDVTPNYKLSTELNNIHFIADIYSFKLGGQKSNYLLKSLPYNYDVFDWTKDFLQLPTTPVALNSFKGRVYVFDDNNTYRIEPNNLYIEDSFEGSGCIGHNSIVVTEYGMFYCDTNNVYRHDGNMPYPIADAILPTWTDLDFSYTPIMGFDSKRKSVIISVFDGTDYKFLVYNTFRKRWDIVTKTHSTLPVTALFATKEGHAVYIEQDENVSDLYYKLFSNTTDKREWSWTSKELDMGTATLDKSFLNTVLTGNDALEDTNLAGKLISNTSNGSVGSTYSSLGDGAKYSYSGNPNRQGKTISYVFTDIEGTMEVDSIGTAYRRL